MPDCYLVPQIQDFSPILQAQKILQYRPCMWLPPNSSHSCRCIQDGHHQPVGLYKFLRVPFGLKNASQASQHLMDTVCQGLGLFFVYQDDILVGSGNAEEHKTYLNLLLQRLQDYCLVDFSRMWNTTSPSMVPCLCQIKWNFIRNFKKPIMSRGYKFVGMVLQLF